jgi:dTDP-4-dehydrorhamnose 3,5-epimerase
MDLVDLRLSGLKLIKPRSFEDERGFFLESYRQPLYAKAGIPDFVQDNLSFSKKNVIRALHFQQGAGQVPGQAKLVQVLRGKIFDVAVDLRPSSLTFGQWEAVALDDLLRWQLFIPAGFAHGFCVLSEDALVQYKVSSLYDPNTERSIRWNDPDLNIAWPTKLPILSKRDQNSPFLREILCDDSIIFS